MPGPRARYSLRIREADAVQIGGLTKAGLDVPMGTLSTPSGGRIARLGPDEWFIMEDILERPSVLVLDIRQALAPAFFSLVDVSHRSVTFVISGVCAREIINGGCPVDLRDRSFPARSCKRTLFGKAEIILSRLTGASDFEIDCWRSYSPYVSALLNELGREFHTMHSDNISDRVI